MSILVEPGNINSTHHLSLSDGLHIVGLDACDSQGNAKPMAITRTPVPRTALKTSTGDQKYSDFEPPWSPISQNDWKGGRGSDDAETDATRFFDSYRANTAFGTIMNGPQTQWTKGPRVSEDYLPGSVTFVALLATNLYYARLITAAASMSAASILMLIRRKGTPKGNLTVSLYGNTAGAPGTLVKSVTLTPANFTDTTSEWWRFTFATVATYTSGTYYWITVSTTEGTDTDHWQIGMKQETAVSTNYLVSANGSSWSQTTQWPYFRIEDNATTVPMKQFQFRGAMYAYKNTDGAAPKLYLLGDRGVADANTGALSTLVDATKTWTSDQWKGCVVCIISGTGSGESQAWRTITGNSATALTVDTPWLVTHGADTEYVIQGSNTWTEITGHGLTDSITDVTPIGILCYFCQGDAINMRRMYINSTGVHTWDADGTNKATFLCLEADTTVWRANNAGTRSLSSATKVTAWGTSLTFGTAVTLVDDYGNVTNLLEYNDVLWVMREGMVFYHNITASTFVSIKLNEMRSVMAYTNGRSALQHNVYLYFCVGGGLERYYSTSLDDVGPDRDKGLPSNRKGVICSMTGYPGRFFAAIDAGTTGYSSVLEHNGDGWHEIYRAPYGQRITDIGFEAVPGSSADRLYVCMSPDIIWLPFPSGTLDPRNDISSLYTHESCVTSGYFYAGLYDAIKYIHSIKLFTEDLEDGVCTVEVEYQLDDDAEWRPLNDYYKVSPIDEVFIDPHSKLGGCTGRRIRYRVHLLTTNASKTPEIKGVVLEAITRVPIKYSYSMSYRLKDAEGDSSAITKRDLLEEWAAQLTPLTMHSIFKAYDNKSVFIDPSPSHPYQETKEGYIETLTVIEV